MLARSDLQAVAEILFCIKSMLRGFLGFVPEAERAVC